MEWTVEKCLNVTHLGRKWGIEECNDRYIYVVDAAVDTERRTNLLGGRLWTSSESCLKSKFRNWGSLEKASFTVVSEKERRRCSPWNWRAYCILCCWLCRARLSSVCGCYTAQLRRSNRCKSGVPFGAWNPHLEVRLVIITWLECIFTIKHCTRVP